MKLIETTISETTVRMRFADNPDPAQAKEALEFAVPLATLRLDEANLLGDPTRRTLGATQRAALYRVQVALGEAEQAISKTLGR
jgi:hypothetical protein